MESKGQRLKVARNRAGFRSANKAADSLGISASTYRAHENGQNGFSAEEAERYARKFGVRSGWIYFGESPVGKNAVPSMGKDDSDADQGCNCVAEICADCQHVADLVGTGGVRFRPFSRATDLPDGTDCARKYWQLPDWVFAEMNVARTDVIAIPVRNDSLQPMLEYGDIAFIDTSERAGEDAGLYAVLDEKGDVAIRQLGLASPEAADGPAPDRIIGRYLRRFTR